MSKIALLQNDCQIIHYIFDFPTKTRHAFLEYDQHMVEAIASRAPIEPLKVFYWQENLLNPNHDPMALILDCKRIDNKKINMELKPELAPSFKYWDVEATSFYIDGKDIDPERPITMVDIGFIHMQVFLKDNVLAKIREDKLILYDPSRSNPDPSQESYPKPKPKKSKKQAKVRRLNVPPRDVVKYYRKEEPELGWELPLMGMYLMSYWDHVKRQRIFNGGVACLAAWCGLSEHQIINIHNRMKVRRVETKKGSSVKGIIKLRGRGWPGEGASRWELPCNMGLVMRWRRSIPKK